MHGLEGRKDQVMIQKIWTKYLWCPDIGLKYSHHFEIQGRGGGGIMDPFLNLKPKIHISFFLKNAKL